MEEHNHDQSEEDHHNHKDSCGCTEDNPCPYCGLNPNDCNCGFTHSKHNHNHDHDHDDNWNLLIGAGIGNLLAFILLQTSVNPILPNIILIITMIIVGYPLAISGITSLLRQRININLLVTIAAIGATFIGEFEEGALVVFLFSISLKLETIATDKAKNAITELMKLKPEVVTLKQGDEEVVVPIERVVPGEIFIVKPGDRIPLDGVILNGETTVDQSTITGESVPVEKGYHEEVYAGTINVDGFIVVETKRASQETMLANILRMVQEAENRKSPTETFVNKFAKYYTPLIVVLALMVALIPILFFRQPLVTSVYNSLVLLVIGCPCALTIATPVAMVSAITSASRHGVLVKGSTYIEQLSNADAFMFDKTGTLTKGQLEVVEVISYIEDEDLLQIAATLEENSKHPIATAICEKADSEQVTCLNVKGFKSKTGKGVEALIDGSLYRIGSRRYFDELNFQYNENDLNRLENEGKTSVLVFKEENHIGVISLQDQIRIGAKETITVLNNEGLKVEMLTGDNLNTAKAIAESLGINGYQANLLPDEKVVEVEKVKLNEVIAMIGDGVNDAPALAAADIGIAMGGLGSDVSLETADVVLLEDDLTKLSYIWYISKRTMKILRENIAISLFVKFLVVLLGALGFVSLWMAVIIGDVGLTLLVILNSIRISQIKPL